MRIRDILMVVVALGALLFGWSQEGSVTLRRGFVIPLADSDVLVHHYPQPVVVDWKYDRKPVLIGCPRPDTLAVYPTYHARRNFEDVFVHMAPLRQVQVYSTIVGIAAGNITAHHHYHRKPPIAVSDDVSRRESQQHDDTMSSVSSIIVIVTDDYRIEAYDPNLGNVWSNSIVPLEQAGIVLHHAAITILTERIYEQDKGTVVVSLRVAGANGTEHMMVAAFAGGTGEFRWRHVEDDYAAGTSTSSSPPSASGSSANSSNHSSGVVDLEPSLLMMNSEYALAQRSSDLHWTHFREAVIRALPHSYSHGWDATVVPHVVFHKKNRKKHRHAVVDGNNGAPLKYKDRNVGLRSHDVGTLGETIGADRIGALRTPKPLAPQSRMPQPPSYNSIVVHTKHGIDVLHLYTGKRVTHVYPLKPHVAYHDVDDDFHIDAIGTKFGTHMSVHHRHGVDLVVDCLGAVTSGAPVAADPMYNATICDTEGFFSGLSLVSHFIRHPSDADDGDDVGGSKRAADALSLIGSQNIAHETTRGVTPVVVQHLIRKGSHMYKAQRHAVFLIDTGLVTCVDPVGKSVLWRLQTDATFTDSVGDVASDEQEVSMGLHSEEEKESRVRWYPHLTRYAVHQPRSTDVRLRRPAFTRYREVDPFVIAVGHHALSVINARAGSVVHTVTLDSPPVAPSLVADVNGDGVNDLVVFSANAVYGYIAHQQASSSVVTMLILVMLAILASLVIARELRVREYEEESSDLLPTTATTTSSSSTSAAFLSRRGVKRSTD